MKRSNYVFMFFSAFLCYTAGNSLAFSQEVYKWKDADGKMHYGDRQATDGTTPKTEVKLPKGGADFVSGSQIPNLNPGTQPKSFPGPNRVIAPPQPKPFDQGLPLLKRTHQPEIKMVMPAKTPENEKLLAMGIPALQNCVNLARSLSNAEGADENKTFRLKFLAECRELMVECVAYRSKPEKNQCMPSPRPEKGTLTRFTENP